jgi:DNA-binding GntR family transcriptional regulator
MRVSAYEGVNRCTVDGIPNAISNETGSAGPAVGSLRPRGKSLKRDDLPLGRVTSPLLIEEIARVLREQIVEGALAPGRRLSERELGARLGVSRTPLREALRLLAGERLVEVLPRRGARVAALDEQVVEDVFPVLSCLERLAVDLACRCIDEEALAELDAILARLRVARQRKDKRRFFALSADFHDAILAASGNTTVGELHRQLSGQVQRARFMSVETEAEWDEALREHVRLLGALRKRNGSAAVEAVSRRLGTNKKKVLREIAGD